MPVKRASIIVGLVALAALVIVGITRATSVHANPALPGTTAAANVADEAVVPNDYLDRHPVAWLERQTSPAADSTQAQPQALEDQPLAPDAPANEYAPATASGGTAYSGPAHRTIVKKRSFKHSAAIVGGSAGAGAAIGALAGGGKGAGIGAIIGGASGFIYDRATHKKVVQQ